MIINYLSYTRDKPFVFQTSQIHTCQMLKLIQRSGRGVRTMSSTVNQSEVEKFKQMSSDWWNPNGVCKPLHSMNRLRLVVIPRTVDVLTPISLLVRVPLVRDGMIETGMTQPELADTDKPLTGTR